MSHHKIRNIAMVIFEEANRKQNIQHRDVSNKLKKTSHHLKIWTVGKCLVRCKIILKINL